VLQSTSTAWSKHWHAGRMRPADSFCAVHERFCVPYITQSHNYIALATQPLHFAVTHHWSTGQYV